MAGITVPISYPTNTVDLQKSIEYLKQSRTATDQLRASTKALGTDTATAGRQTSTTLEAMKVRLEQLRGQINNTSQANTAQLQKLSAQYKELQAEIDKTTKKLFEQTKAVNEGTQGWNGMFNAVKLFITAGIVREVSQIALSMATLRGNIDGVTNAFNKLPNSVILLNDIRKATHGTIDDFKLMQLALKAENFKIPLTQLGTLLEFAATRAQQTGISVDYLTESIITGLGRKSIKILDNLQINVADLNHRVNDLGMTYGDAVGQIANEELKKMGGYLITSKTSVEQLNVQLETTKQILAKGWLGSASGGFMQFINEGLAGINNFLKGQKEVNKDSAAEGVSIFLKSISTDQDKAINLITNEINRRKELSMAIREEIETLKDRTKINGILSSEENEQRERMLAHIRVLQERRDVINQSVPLLEAAIDAQLKQNKLDEKEIVTLTTMKEKVKALTESFNDEIDFMDRRSYLARAKQIRQLQEEIDRREELLSIKKEDKQIVDDVPLEQSMANLDHLFKAWSKLDEAVIPTLNNIEEDNAETTDEILGTWQEFFTRFRIGWTEGGKRMRSEQDQMNAAIRQGKTLAFNITESLLMAEVNAEVNSYAVRIAKAQTYYDDLIKLAGDNERRKVELGVLRDKEIERLERKKDQAQTRASKRKVYIDAAQAVARAFADYEYPYSLIVAALAGGAAAAQINEINKAPKGYAKGVIGLKGKGTETSDSIPAMLSKNESVMTAKETRDSWKTLHAIRAGKINDKVIDQIMKGQVTVVGSDDRETAAKLDELIKTTKANRQDDLVEKHGILYRVRKKGETSRQYIRSKYGNFE